MAVRDDVVNTIAAFSLFADLTGPQLEEVAHLFDESFFGQGERILRQGVSGSGFYVILEGTAGIRAARLSVAALAHQARSGTGLAQVLRETLGHAGPEGLSGPEAAEAWAEGQSMKLDEAVTYAHEGSRKASPVSDD